MHCSFRSLQFAKKIRFYNIASTVGDITSENIVYLHVKGALLTISYSLPVQRKLLFGLHSRE
jgi:hypothetical protein